jgi:hypothetical protein
MTEIIFETPLRSLTALMTANQVEPAQPSWGNEVKETK